MSDQQVSQHPSRLHHEKPFLFSWNRRLRHLHGLSLRNIDTTPTTSRSRGKTITHDDTPYNLTTPTKRQLLNEAQGLTQSRSFTSLAAATKDKPASPQKASTVYQKDGIPSSRPGGKLRRRSTLHWSSASPRARQQKLEEVAAPRLADTWFSIHSKHKQITEPLYVSEIMEKSMNPNFASFDLDNTSPSVARSDECILRIWAKDGRADEYCLLLELNVNLRSLQYIGKSMENFHHPLPQNCVLLHLSDGIYTSFTDLPANNHDFDELGRGVKTDATEYGTTFDSLMQLANLDDCIQDALKTRSRLEKEINAILSRKQSQRDGSDVLQPTKENLSATKAAITTISKQKAQLTKRKDELRDTIRACRKSLNTRAEREATLTTQLETTRTSVSTLTKSSNQTSEQSSGQIRRIGETLLKIFPIEPIRHKTLQFTIRSIHLPNSVFDDTNRDEIAAALGFTAQLIHQLSLYLSTPLPYPIEHNGSESYILDPISLAMAQRKYPLFPINVAYKFEYAVFLLNKDVEFLMNKVGLRMLDIRHTLPNLKYLLYVLTAGTGELPARKAGGVRGLLGGNGKWTPSVSRKGSSESVTSDSSKRAGSFEYTRNGSILANSLAVQMPNKEKALDQTGLDDPFYSATSPRSATGLAYRHSGLRDAS